MPKSDATVVKELVTRMAQAALSRSIGRAESVTTQAVDLTDRTAMHSIDFTCVRMDREFKGRATVQYNSERGQWMPGNVFLEGCAYMCAYNPGQRRDRPVVFDLVTSI
ncbi:MAG: hypothetical protein WC497_02985 [Patescibacteria group bacterium]